MLTQTVQDGAGIELTGQRESRRDRHDRQQRAAPGGKFRSYPEPDQLTPIQQQSQNQRHEEREGVAIGVYTQLDDIFAAAGRVHLRGARSGHHANSRDGLVGILQKPLRQREECHESGGKEVADQYRRALVLQQPGRVGDKRAHPITQDLPEHGELHQRRGKTKLGEYAAEIPEVQNIAQHLGGNEDDSHRDQSVTQGERHGISGGAQKQGQHLHAAGEVEALKSIQRGKEHVQDDAQAPAQAGQHYQGQELLPVCR